MSVIIAADGKPNEIRSFDELAGKNAGQILELLGKASDTFKLAIRTPFFMESIEKDKLPLQDYPELLVSKPDNYSFPDYYLRLLQSTSSLKIALNVQPITQMTIPLPMMLVPFGFEGFPELTIEDVLDHCATTFGYETSEQSIIVNDTEMNPEESALQFFDLARTSHVQFKSTVSDASAKKIRQRNAHAHEFFESEKTFIDNLNTIVNYLEPEIKKKQLFDENEHRKLFRDIPTILERHLVLFRLLEQEGPSYCSRFAGILLNVIDSFTVAAAFVSNFKTRDEMIKHKRETRSFDRALNEIENANPDNLGRTFLSYYITPVQRYPRYTLLLRDLDKVTPPWHPDKQFFHLAMTASERVNKEIDHVSYRVKQLVMMDELQKELPDNYSILENGRDVLQKTAVRFIKPKSMNGIFYLFNDIILLTIKQKKTQTPVLRSPLTEFAFANNRPVRNGMTLYTDNKEYVIIFDEPLERENWFEAFYQLRSSALRALTCDCSFVRWRDIDVGDGVSPVMNLDCVVVSGIAYFFGGINQSLALVSTLVQYNYAMNEWSVSPTPVTPRYSHAMVTYAGVVYVFFGKNKKGVCNDIWAYTIKTSTWQQLKCPSAEKYGRFGHTAVLLGDNIVIFGGQNSHGKLTNDILLFNPTTINLTEFPAGAKAPPPRIFHSAARLTPKKMIVVGGKLEKSIDGEVYVFNLAKNSWHHKSKIGGRPRYNHHCLMSGNFLIIAGGCDSKNDARLSVIDTNSWSRISLKEFGNVPTGLTRFGAGMLNDNTLITYGGADIADKVPFPSAWVMEIGYLQSNKPRHKSKRKKDSLLVHRAESADSFMTAPKSDDSSPTGSSSSPLRAESSDSAPSRARHKSVSPETASQLAEFRMIPVLEKMKTRDRLSVGSAFDEIQFAQDCGIDLLKLPLAFRLAAKMKLKTLFSMRQKNTEDLSKMARMESIISGGGPPIDTTFLLKIYDDTSHEIHIKKVTNSMSAADIMQFVFSSLGREAILSLRIRPGKMSDVTDENLHEAFCHVYRKEMPTLMISAI